MNKITDLSNMDEENYQTHNISETNQSSPMLSYKLNKYRRFFHPITADNLIKLVILEKPQNPEYIQDIPESPLVSPKLGQANNSENEYLRNEFKKFNIKDAILSPSPRSKKKANANSTQKIHEKTIKSHKSCFSLFKLKSNKELKKWWINSPSLSIIATTYHSFKYYELQPESSTVKCLTYFKKFPKCEDLSINIESFAELGEASTILIKNLITMKKMHKIIDIRFVTFPGEKTLWHGPAFLFNSVMGFNMDEECIEGSNRLELWHRFRSYFDRGAFQSELIEILTTINIRLKEEKLQILHLIFSSHTRINDDFIPYINETLQIYLKNLKEFKLLISSRQLSNLGIQKLCQNIDNISPKNLKSFHIFIDYRSKNITDIGIMSLCKTLLGLAENNIIEYLSLGFLSNSIKDLELMLMGDALRMLSKNVRSLVLIIAGNMSDEGILKLLDGLFEGPYLRKISLGFMGSELKGSKVFNSLVQILAKKTKNGKLSVFHLYYNNNLGVRNEQVEQWIKNELGNSELEMETYIFC